MNLIAGRVNDQLILVISENSVAVKQADEQLVVWVTQTNGDPLPNATVSVYTRSGSIINNGTTNSDGLVEVTLPSFAEGGPAATEPLMVAAQVGNDITLTGLSSEWQSSGGYYDWQSSQPASASSAAFIFTERPIYKPGQTVYFKAIVRQDDDALLTMPPADTAVTIQIRDARNNVVQTQELQTNHFGSVHGNFTIADGATLGIYKVELNYSGSSHSQIFKVEDYRKPDYEVTVTTDAATYIKGDRVEITVDTAYFFGEPVSAEVSLALVDEAIFALSPELNGLMYDSFYYERGSVVHTYNSYTPIRYLWQGGMGGGGDGGISTGNPRQDFPDTAVWQPNLYTNFNGEVSVTVTLPDSLTSWRATADTQVGEATANIITRQDVIVRPLLPRVLTMGDTMALSAIVHNFGETTQTINVELTIDDLRLTIGDETVQTITLQPGEQQIVGWPVEAVAAGEVQILITATSDDAVADAIQLPLTIQPLAIPDVTTQVGQFTGQRQFTITVPEDALPMSHVELQISRSIAGSMLEGLQYLTGYPYGCVEQTMSKALPNAVVGRAQ